MKRNNGISLIVLVITIIVIIILAGAVILSLSNNNPITQANEATFKTSVDAYNSELSMVMSNKYVSDFSFNPKSLNAGTWNGGSTIGTIKQYIPSITDSDAKKFEIQNGKLVYVGDTTVEQSYITSMGLSNKLVLGVNTIATKNTTVNGSYPAYNNPIIPVGFKAVDTAGAIWGNVITDWNKGLVIEDVSGNQFVWVPVDGTNVPYTKWCATGIANTSTSDDILPVGITSELDQIKNYGGFYVARFEAGKESGTTLVSKKGISSWTSITYTNAKLKAESMYATTSVNSGLITGAQWDTVMEWLKDSGKSVSDSRTWGNYKNSLSPSNVTGFGVPQVTGYSDFWTANNIYDMAGNVWEWTSEKYTNGYVLRGGEFFVDGLSYPAPYRILALDNGSGFSLTFRVVLYIK